MQAENYRAVAAWFDARPAAKRGLKIAVKVTVALVYLLYAGLLAALLVLRDARFLRVLLVPAAVFVIGTVLRAVIDRPRPYEKLNFTPLFPKSTHGKSMPSRHAFCAAGIAVAAWYAAPALGVFGAVLALGVAVSRVLSGVHYPSDVLAGLAIGSVLAVIGFYCI